MRFPSPRQHEEERRNGHTKRKPTEQKGPKLEKTPTNYAYGDKTMSGLSKEKETR